MSGSRGSDHTRLALWVGTMMIAGAFLTLWLKPGPFPITALVWGSLIFCLGLFLHYRLLTRGPS